MNIIVFPCSLEVIEDLVEAFYFLGGQDSRRFVEYQNLCLSEEYFKNFDPLAHTNGKVFYSGFGIYLESDVLCEFPNSFLGFLPVQDTITGYSPCLG